jgi:hypothetical protein
MLQFFIFVIVVSIYCVQLSSMFHVVLGIARVKIWFLNLRVFVGLT